MFFFFFDVKLSIPHRVSAATHFSCFVFTEIVWSVCLSGVWIAAKRTGGVGKIGFLTENAGACQKRRDEKGEAQPQPARAGGHDGCARAETMYIGAPTVCSKKEWAVGSSLHATTTPGRGRFNRNRSATCMKWDAPAQLLARRRAMVAALALPGAADATAASAPLTRL